MRKTYQPKHGKCKKNEKITESAFIYEIFFFLDASETQSSPLWFSLNCEQWKIKPRKKNWITYHKKKLFVYGCLNANCIRKYIERNVRTMEMYLFGITLLEINALLSGDKWENLLYHKNFTDLAGCGIS